MNTHRDIIDKWPMRVAFARDIGVTEGAAHAMYRRYNIPVEYWPALLTAAKRRGLQGITKAVLVATAKPRARSSKKKSEDHPAPAAAPSPSV